MLYGAFFSVETEVVLTSAEQGALEKNGTGRMEVGGLVSGVPGQFRNVSAMPA